MFVYIYIQTISYSDQYNLSVRIYIYCMHKKKGYPSNYREALLYICMCLLLFYLFSTEKKQQQEKYTMYNDMQNGKE